ncbi:MAG: damage-control phosphatase ARMT1 family protein [Desulfobulbus sp.]|jgi:uncharacterized protein with ATP-grasp and redox domains
MRTGPDCLPCFMRQALATVRRSTDDPAEQWRLTAEVGAMLAGFSPDLPSPENAVRYYRYIAAQTGVADPYHAEKAESTRFALSVEEQVRACIRQEPDPLRAALLFAINGNVLDYGAQYLLDRSTILDACRTVPVIDHFARLQHVVRRKPAILYLADNCGEIVFDKLLIEQLLARGCRVTLVVRGSPIINDATMADAEACGLTALCPVIDNGADLPGTSLAQGSETLRRLFSTADCIISKGMGNFECLSDVCGPLFFLFIVKCNTVLRYLADLPEAAEAALRIGSPVLLQGRWEG